MFSIFAGADGKIQEANSPMEAHSRAPKQRTNSSGYDPNNTNRTITAADLARVNQQEQVSKFAKWNNAYINDLPDSAFAFIESGGKKDKSGKTFPRSLRHLPYKDKDGKVDMSHLRNAIARSPQIKLKDGKMISKEKSSSIQSRLQRMLKGKKSMSKNEKTNKVGNMNVSKFSEEGIKSRKLIGNILEQLQKLAKDKKEDENVELSVKDINNLNDDLIAVQKELEEVQEELDKTSSSEDDEDDSEAKDGDEGKEGDEADSGDDSDDKDDSEGDEDEQEEDESKKKSKKKSKTKDKDEDDPGESDDEDNDDDSEEDEEEESKFQKALKLCDGYRKELKKQEELVSKFKEENDKLSDENERLKSKVSKFQKIQERKQAERYDTILNDTLEKYSKFKELSAEEKVQKEQEWRVSKMSEAALLEIGSTIEASTQNPVNSTQPSEYLDTSEPEDLTLDETMSKMSADDKIRLLSQVGAEVQRQKRMGR